jgi:hypothetical protein
MKYAETVKENISEMNSLEWWYIISKKRCDDYAHLQEDDYNEAPKTFLT